MATEGRLHVSVSLRWEHLCMSMYCLGVFMFEGGPCVLAQCLCVCLWGTGTAHACLCVSSAGLRLGVYMYAHVYVYLHECVCECCFRGFVSGC